MILKSSTVALVISSVLAVSANANDLQQANQKLSVGNITKSTQESNTDVKSPFVISKENTGVYLIRLSEKSALDASYAKLGDDRSSIVANIDKQQDSVLNSIRSLDSTAVLTRKARLTENALYVQISHEAAKQLTSNSNILTVELLNEEPSYTSADEFKKFPFLEIKDPGDSVTVAIIGNGIDYTHAALGGVGTKEAYEKAWSNRSNAWDGFPTDTVIGGLDFSAQGEGYHSIDYNPIEAAGDLDVESGAIPSGTAVAARILAQAPDAKILAYKTYDWDSAYFFPVLDVIIDPNQDGDISDRPDVIVMNAYGNGAFYVEDDTQGSSPTREINLVRRLSAAGSLVVVSAGTTYYNSYFNLAWRGAVPEALTVGSVNINDDGIVLSEFTPAGPVRGTHLLKPEVVAPAENIFGPIAGSGSEEGDFSVHSTYAAAYAAGTVAKILAEYPLLSPIEAKALVANTADANGIKGTSTHNEEFDKDITTVAEVPFMGTGLVDGSVAVTANAVVWQTSDYQPNLAFGFVEAASSATVSRDVTIKNLTDEVQTYSLSTLTHGEKENNAAVSFIYPATINVPANHSVVFNVSMIVDASKLTEQGMLNTNDYTIENFTKENINGYLVFDNSNEDSAQLKMSWQVFPKNASKLEKSNLTATWAMPYPAQEWLEQTYMVGSQTYAIDITNNGNVDKTVYSVPLMHSVAAIKESKVGGQGHMIKNIGASINADQMCASGSKLTVAVQMFDKFDIPMAEHFDKAGHLLTYFGIYASDYVDSHYGNVSTIDGDGNKSDNDILAYIEVLMDENGKPQVEYVDYDMEYEWWNPNGRKKQSVLGADVSIGDDTLVANICVDELFHDDIQSTDVWDQDLGWQFATDRDAKADVNETMLRYNPVIMGRAFTEVIDHTGEYNYPQYTYQYCNNEGMDPSTWPQVPKEEDYCIEEKNTFLGNHTGIAKITDDEEAELTWMNKVTLSPQETANASVTIVGSCDPYLQWAGGSAPPLHDLCTPGVMIFELGSENTSYTKISYGADIGIKAGQGFSVYENSENGTVIGNLALHAEYFYSEEKYLGTIHLVNALPGTPFYVAADGTITVANSDAIDYEEAKSFTLKVQVDYINRDTQIVDILIKVHNRNDVAPEMVSSLADISGKVNEQVNTSIAAVFIDAEGDGITFSSTDLPAGLALSNSGVISGTFEQSGNYQATITATDGKNSLSSKVNISIAKSSAKTELPSDLEETSSNGGSTGVLFFILAGLTFLNRRIGRH